MSRMTPQPLKMAIYSFERQGLTTLLLIVPKQKIQILNINPVETSNLIQLSLIFRVVILLPEDGSFPSQIVAKKKTEILAVGYTYTSKK
jgi:hypothetical protein